VLSLEIVSELMLDEEASSGGSSSQSLAIVDSLVDLSIIVNKEETQLYAMLSDTDASCKYADGWFYRVIIEVNSSVGRLDSCKASDEVVARVSPGPVRK
jgi:DNA polymerase sigma